MQLSMSETTRCLQQGFVPKMVDSFKRELSQPSQSITEDALMTLAAACEVHGPAEDLAPETSAQPYPASSIDQPDAASPHSLRLATTAVTQWLQTLRSSNFEAVHNDFAVQRASQHSSLATC